MKTSAIMFYGAYSRLTGKVIISRTREDLIKCLAGDLYETSFEKFRILPLDEYNEKKNVVAILWDLDLGIKDEYICIEEPIEILSEKSILNNRVYFSIADGTRLLLKRNEVDYIVESILY